MKFFIILLIVFLCISASISYASEQDTKIIELEGKHKESEFQYPTLELKGRAAKIFIFYDAEYISGLTCQIKYNGDMPLPNKVFFAEYDSSNLEISGKVRLVYPKLNVGESGYATFKIKGTPSRIIIWSEGEGPWESPY